MKEKIKKELYKEAMKGVKDMKQIQIIADNYNISVKKRKVFENIINIMETYLNENEEEKVEIIVNGFVLDGCQDSKIVTK